MKTSLRLSHIWCSGVNRELFVQNFSCDAIHSQLWSCCFPEISSLYLLTWFFFFRHQVIIIYNPFRKKSSLDHDARTTCLRNYFRSPRIPSDRYLEKEAFVKLAQLRKHHVPASYKCNKSWTQSWMDRVHFVSLPTYDFGNWIPYALMHWPCFGSGCALAQVVIKSSEGWYMQP